MRKKTCMLMFLVMTGFFFLLSHPVKAWTGDGYSGPVVVTTNPDGTIFRMAAKESVINRVVCAVREWAVNKAGQWSFLASI